MFSMLLSIYIKMEKYRRIFTHSFNYSHFNRFLTDFWANINKHFSDDTWNNTINNLYSYIWQLYLLKKKNQFLKTLLSIDNWSYLSNFAVPTSSAQKCNKFAETAVQLVEDFDFDDMFKILRITIINQQQTLTLTGSILQMRMKLKILWLLLKRCAV